MSLFAQAHASLTGEIHSDGADSSAENWGESSTYGFSLAHVRAIPHAHSLLNLQPSSTVNRFWSHALRRLHISAHSSRRLLTLGLKSCSLFTLFTTCSPVRPWTSQ